MIQEKLLEQIDKLQKDLEILSNMPDKEVCERYKTDDAEEIRNFIKEEIENYEEDLEEIECEYSDINM
jgi:hypothetical protein